MLHERMTVRACPVCAGDISPQTTPIQTHREYTLLHCPTCSVQFWWPFQHPGKEWYDQTDIYAGRVLGANTQRIYWNHQQLLDEQIPKGTLLDIGCGNGSFISAAKRKGYDVSGIDFDEDAIKIARRSGLENVWAISLEEFIQQGGQKYDVITFFEVLEHLDNPMAFLLSVKKLLKPGGYVALSLPNRLRWPRVVNLAGIDLPPHHLSRWDGPSLRYFLQRAGFEIVTLTEQPMDTQSVLSCLQWMLPYRRLWHGAGKLLRDNNAKGETSSSDREIKYHRSAFAHVMKGAYYVHRTLLLPIAGTLSLYLRAKKVRGMGLYTCAKLKG